LCAFFQATPAELGFPDASDEEEKTAAQESIYEAEDGITRTCIPSMPLFLLIGACIILAIVILSLRPS